MLKTGINKSGTGGLTSTPACQQRQRIDKTVSIDTAHRLATAHPGQTVVMVAHGGVLDCLYRAACGMPIEAPRTWQLGNASINRLLFTGTRLTMVGWGDTQHLEGGALEESSDGGIARPGGVAAHGLS